MNIQFIGDTLQMISSNLTMHVVKPMFKLGLQDYLQFFLIKAYTEVFLFHFLVLSFHLHYCTGFALWTLSLFRCLAKLCITRNDILFPSRLGPIFYRTGG